MWAGDVVAALVAGTGRAVEVGVAVVEHGPVGRDEPVAPVVGCRGHGDDRAGQAPALERPVRSRVTESEDTAGAARQPVAPAIPRRHDRHDRRLGGQCLDGAVELGATEAEHTSTRGRDPVAATAGAHGHADFLLNVVPLRDGAEVARGAEGDRLPGDVWDGSRRADRSGRDRVAQAAGGRRGALPSRRGRCGADRGSGSGSGRRHGCNRHGGDDGDSYGHRPTSPTRRSGVRHRVKVVSTVAGRYPGLASCRGRCGAARRLRSRRRRGPEAPQRERHAYGDDEHAPADHRRHGMIQLP